eukprot:6490534-Amphidinium_carterae.1
MDLSRIRRSQHILQFPPRNFHAQTHPSPSDRCPSTPPSPRKRRFSASCSAGVKQAELCGRNIWRICLTFLSGPLRFSCELRVQLRCQAHFTDDFSDPHDSKSGPFTKLEVRVGPQFMSRINRNHV